MELYFAEVWAPTSVVGARTFDVKFEGATVKEDLDVFAEAAGSSLTQTYRVTVTDGVMNLGLGGGVENAMLSGTKAVRIADAPVEAHVIVDVFVDEKTVEFDPDASAITVSLSSLLNDQSGDVGEYRILNDIENADGGSVNVAGGGYYLRYAPDKGFSGAETITLRVQDQSYDNAPIETVTLTVNVPGEAVEKPVITTDPRQPREADDEAGEKVPATDIVDVFVDEKTVEFDPGDASIHIPLSSLVRDETADVEDLRILLGDQGAENGRGAAGGGGTYVFYRAEEDFSGAETLSVRIQDRNDPNAPIETVTLTINVPGEAPFDESALEPTPVIALSVIDAASDEVLYAALEDGETLESGDISIVATPDIEVGSVSFYVNGALQQTESVAPFAMFGDFRGDYFGGALADGDYDVRVVLHSEARGGGDVLGETSVSFSVAATEPGDAEAAAPAEPADQFVFIADSAGAENDVDAIATAAFDPTFADADEAPTEGAADYVAVPEISYATLFESAEFVELF